MRASLKEIKTTEEGSQKKGQQNLRGNRSFLEKYKSLFGGSFFLALAFHVLLLIGFGSYTVFKGSAPQMPFTSEGGVPEKDAGMEAPPENAPDMVEETAMDSNPTPSDAPTTETDTVLAVSGVVSPSMSFQTAPSVLAAPASTGMEKRLSQPGARSGAKASSVNFFGVKGDGSNVYFLVDVSDSMLENGRGGIKGFADVKKKLNQMIQSLDEQTKFNVVTFGAYEIGKPGADLFRSSSVSATPEIKKSAETFISQYNVSYDTRGPRLNNYHPKIERIGLLRGDKGSSKVSTRLDLALEAAFEGLADTIFLISDGKAPVLAEGNPEKLSEANRVKHQKDRAEWEKAVAKYKEDIEAYRIKYQDLLAEKERRTAEAKSKGQAKVVEGREVDYGIKILGLPSAPTQPHEPAKPGGKIYEEGPLIQRIKELYTAVYKESGATPPSIHTVGYMSKPNETKFLQALASKNNGTFKAISAPIKESAPSP
jgi:hypothetical protein